MITSHNLCGSCNRLLPPQSHYPIPDVPESAQGFYPLEQTSDFYSGNKLLITECRFCGLVQLCVTPVKYHREVIRAVGYSDNMKLFRLNQFASIKSEYLARADSTALEIGAGRGEYTLLISKIFNTVKCTEYSSEAVQECRNAGLTAFQTHPELTTFHQDLEHQTFDFICCFSYLEHLPRPVAALKTILKAAHPETIFLIEVPNSEMIFRHGLLNEIIPDHLHYFTGNTLIKTLDAAGFQIVSMKNILDGYVLSAVCRPASKNVIPSMIERYETFKNATNALLASHRRDARIVVWGAGHQALSTISTTKLKTRVSYIVDNALFKQGKRAPGSGVPIYPPSHMLTDPPDILIIACAGYNGEVHQQLVAMKLCNLAVYLLSGLKFHRST